MNDLNIVGGTIVRPEGCFEGSVEVKGGAIAAVKRAGEAPAPAAETVDAAGMLGAGFRTGRILPAAPWRPPQAA